jgi:hypothetical protein
MKGRMVVQGAVLAGALALAPAGPALAHECYVAKMSPTAVEKVTANSPNWFRGEMSELFGIIHMFEIPGVDTPLNSSQVAYAAAQAEAAGVPTELAIFEKALIPKGKGVTHEKMVDGKGIDWFFHRYGGTIIGAYFDALTKA